jgi:hypothetical protein
MVFHLPSAFREWSGFARAVYAFRGFLLVVNE